MSSNNTNYRDLLDQKQYIKLMVANAVSRFGDSVDSIAFSWIMYEVSGSASLIALIMALNYLPNVFLQPFLGVWAEGCSKRKIMVLCDLGRAATVAVTAVLFSMDLLTPILLIIITLVNSTLESVRMPAGNAILPHILEKKKYTIGMALNQTLARICEIIGMGLAGLIIATWGSHTALLIDAATFIFSGAVISMIKYTEVLEKVTLSVRAFGERLMDGVTYIKSKPTLFFFILLGAFINFSLAPINAFQSVYVADILSVGPEMLSAMGIVLTLGMALGAFITPKLMKLMKGRTLLLLSGAFETAAMLAFWAMPYIDSKWIMCIGILLFAAVLGAGTGIVSVIFGATFTSRVDTSYMARVSAITNAALCSIAPIAALLCSALAVFLTIPTIFLIFAVVHIIMYTVVAFANEYRDI